MSSVILYTTDDGKSQIRRRADGQTVWLSQRGMAVLFDVSVDNVGLHRKNIYQDDELGLEATAEESSVVQTDPLELRAVVKITLSRRHKGTKGAKKEGTWRCTRMRLDRSLWTARSNCTSR